MSNESLLTALPDELDALFGQYTAADNARGLVYGLVGPDGLVHSRGFGVADDAGHPPDADTVFPIASMTKSFVACGALLARDRGLVNLDAPITDFFDEFSAGGTFDDPCDPPTLRMLLSMSGGLTEDNSWVDPFIDTPVDDLLATVSRGLYYSTLPGTVFEYSNLGYTLAGLAVGRAVGRRIEDWVSEELLAPLGMSRSWFDNQAPADPGLLATGYSLDESGQWQGFPPARSDAYAAAGGIQSTVRDLATWVSWLASSFRPPTGTGPDPVGRASRRELQRLHQLTLPSVVTRADGAVKVSIGGYGLGLLVTEDLHRGTVISHSGGLPGFILNMIWHPGSGHGIVVLTNSHRGNPVALSEEALFRVLDRHRAPARTIRLWPATRDLQGLAESLIRRWDDELAARIFAENIAFDRPLDQRRTEIDRMIGEVGPLLEPNPAPDATPDLLSAATPADVTWAIPGQRGELVCMIHLTPAAPPQIQEFEVTASPYATPRSARPTDISVRRRGAGPASLSSLPNSQIEWPAPADANGG
ncbi:serine hydrolase domain-containing protein [Nakamurella lactea]|uniref:serine hydrolase domain-containing protein n=1 Tax=Nakamurella lactea TaxID=459515 RepID=UPI00042822FF|nr:serine hydrolase domain-containing protein [Nakamurella lactea]